jgi:hypothetical protein
MMLLLLRLLRLLLLLLRLLRLCWLLLRLSTPSAPAVAVAVAPSALPASDVLLPTAGAAHAAATSLLLSIQIGYNGLEQRQSDGRNRYSGDNKRNRNKKLERKIRRQH